MRCHCFLSLSVLFLVGNCVPVVSQTVAIYVSDYHSSPIQGTILSTKGNGSTSPPTDIAGKTKIVMPSEVQPGDELSLTLVHAPVKTMQIMSPWQGRATVPKSTGFIEVVLGVPGDKVALQDPRVVSTWAQAIVRKNDQSGFVVDAPTRNLKDFAKQVGFTPNEIDSAIRSLGTSDDETKRSKAAMYVNQYPSAPKLF